MQDSRRLNWLAALVLVAALGLATGCARRYNITMTNGTQLTAASKPKLQGGYYSYKDANGATQYISQGRVREISTGGPSKNTQFRGTPVKR